MQRCLYCHGAIAKNEDYCHFCGDRSPKQAKATPATPKTTAVSKPAKGSAVSNATNVVFGVSLAVTAYCFFVEHSLSLPIAIAMSSTLVVIRLLAERVCSDRARR